MGYRQYQRRRYYRWVSGTTAGAFFPRRLSRGGGVVSSLSPPPTTLLFENLLLCSCRRHTPSPEVSSLAWITPLRPEGGSRTISLLFSCTMSSGKISPLPLNLVDSLRCVEV